MKIFLLHTIFILAPIFCTFGQNGDIRNQSDFLGQWYFNDENQKITLILESLEHKRLNGEIEHFIVGFLRYEKNGQILINTLDNKVANDEIREYNMDLVGNYTDKEILNFTFSDPLLKKYGDLTLKINNGKLMWKLEEVKYGSKSFNKDKSIEKGFSIPEKISFKREL